MNQLPRSTYGLRLSQMLWLVLLLCSATHAQVVLDLQNQHTLQQIKASGVKLRGFEGDPGFFVIKDTNVILKLPGGQEIESKIQHASFRANANGVLTSLEIHGPIMPNDEAYEVAQKIHHAFHIPTDRLEQWKSAIVGKGRDAPNFTNANNDYYPNVFFEMGDSMNPLYPWYMLIAVGWNALSDDKRDESWGLANNPKPPSGLERLSLDSPSGKTYDRKAAYAHLKREQDELDRRLGQVRGADGHLINPPPLAPKKAPEAKPIRPASSEDPASSRPWSVIAVLLVAATGLLWLLVKNRK